MIFIVVFHFNVSLGGHGIIGKEISMRLIPNGNLGHIGVSLFFMISGAALIHSYKNNFSIMNFFKKRLIALYPMFWIAYAIAFLFLFYVNLSINHSVPKWTFILTVLGFDGYLLYRTPNFYILGEWFLGCIIMLYVCFPILRFLMTKYPKLLLIGVFGLYFVLVANYSFEMPVDRNFLTRIPEFLLGMYFIQYIKKVNIFYVIGAIGVIALMLFKGVSINPMYIITSTGIAVFVVLVYIGQYITIDKIKAPFILISKLSYPIFLAHHVIIDQLLVRFNGATLTTSESYCLFIFTCIVILVISVYLYKLSNNVSRYVSGLLIVKNSLCSSAV